jgi:hypothetical protein
MNITINVELPQDKALLESILRIINPAHTKDEPAETPKTTANGTSVTKTQIAAPPIDNPPPPSITPTHTLESVRAIAHKKKKDDVRALLTEFGVAGLTKLKEEQYNDFMIKLNALA